MNPKVDFFFEKQGPWQEAFQQLRRIILASGLTEELKWGHPCYTLDGNNVVLMHGFKEYCALLFHKGVLLSDPEDILIQQTENVQAARQIRFANVQEILAQETTLNAYIQEAIQVERSGRKVAYKKTSEFHMPEELEQRLEDDPVFRAAFENLTPGRQRGYLLYFSKAKQSATREARIEKYRENILDGKGLNDR